MTQQKLEVRNAGENTKIRPCVCTDQLESCPDNCLLRWF